MKIGIVGCGLIGRKRALALPRGSAVAVCVDVDETRARALAAETGAVALTAVERAVREIPLDAVVIAAINSELVGLAEKFLAAGVPALIEKPAARSIQELETLGRYELPIKIGFNHRFHAAFRDLRAEIFARPDDPIMFIDAKYGNGARLGFEKEWRSAVEIAGGGELLDQGVHLLDLAGALLGDLKVVAGHCRTHFWPTEVDDNAWAILATESGQTVSFHVSATEWKNCFLFEVYTRRRKYVWSGLGRSYGPETLTIYKVKPEMGVPDSEARTYPAEDLSWHLENADFLAGISTGKFDGDFRDGLRALRLVDQIYANSAARAPENHPRWYTNPTR